MDGYIMHFVYTRLRVAVLYRSRQQQQAHQQQQQQKEDDAEGESVQLWLTSGSFAQAEEILINVFGEQAVAGACILTHHY